MFLEDSGGNKKEDFFKVLDAGPDVLHIQVSPMSLVSQSVSLVCQSSCGYFSN